MRRKMKNICARVLLCCSAFLLACALGDGDIAFEGRTNFQKRMLKIKTLKCAKVMCFRIRRTVYAQAHRSVVVNES